MTMPLSDDDMSLREIGRTLADFRAEFRTQLAQLVRADVYREAQAADRARIAALEKALEREEADRTMRHRQLQTAIYTAVGSVVVTLIVAALSLSN